MKLRGILTAAVLFVATAGTAAAGSVLVDFDEPGFTPGDSVDNHLPDGTEAAPPVDYTNWSPPAWASIGNRRSGVRADEEIVDLGGAHGKVWRYSTGIDDGSLGATPKSHHAGFVAGETGAVNDAGMGPATSSLFYGSFDFRSAVTTAQPDLAIRVSASSMDSRHGYVVIDDDGSAFDLLFWRPSLGTYDTIDTNLSYTDWHNLGIEIRFVDGAANDVVNLWLDGSIVYTGPSWEFYYGTPESVDRLSFDIYEDTRYLGGGLYIDNVLVSDVSPAAVVPLPSAAWAGLALLGGLFGRRVLRRRRGLA